MPCYSPNAGYLHISKDGSRKMVFGISQSTSGVRMDVPCGQCIGCRLERSRQWAMRLVHEKRMHQFSWFVTLTYNEDCVPDSLSVRELQLFMKRLRKKFGKLRFFAAGEYGGESNRPHYHLILFGFPIPDLRKYSDNKDGVLFESDSFSKLWKFGTHKIGEVTFESCAYVARYCVEKITGPKADDWYMGRQPEFATMSRRPGIGATWYMKYGVHCFDVDRVILRGREMRPPKYYENKLDDAAAHDLKLRRARMRFGSASWIETWRYKVAENLVDRRRARERHAVAMLKGKKDV